jgi:hypothetical protein
MLKRRCSRLANAAFFKDADDRRNNRPLRNMTIVPPNSAKLNKYLEKIPLKIPAVCFGK